MDEGKKKNLKRFFAGLVAVLFVILIMNIYIWQFYIGVSLGIYVFIIMLFLFVLNRKDGANNIENEKEQE